MSLDRTRQAVEKILDYNWSVLAPDAKGEVIGMDIKATGPAAIEAAANMFYGEVFDMRSEVLNVIIGESGGVAEYDLVGKHIGNFCGVAATGRTVNVRCVSIYDVVGDEITGLRMFLPVSLILEQIGGLRIPDRAPSPEPKEDTS